MIKKKFICSECNSEDILQDAFAGWDFDKQEWVLSNTFNNYVCNECGCEYKPNEVEVPLETDKL